MVKKGGITDEISILQNGGFCPQFALHNHLQGEGDEIEKVFKKCHEGFHPQATDDAGKYKG